MKIITSFALWLLFARGVDTVVAKHFHYSMGDEESFDSTTVDIVLHCFFIKTGFLAIFSVFTPISFSELIEIMTCYMCGCYFARGVDKVVSQHFNYSMGDEDIFESTTVDIVLHYFFIMTGFLAIFSVFSPIRFLFRKSCRSEQRKLGTYRLFLTAIVISGLLWDVHISIFTAPFPLLPHIAFWADGLLVYLHPRMVVYLLGFALFLIFFWLTTLLLAFLYRFHAIAGEKKRKLIHISGYVVVIVCIVNSLISCGILIIRYPPDDRILCAITENHKEMLFLYRKPAFIYFVKLDEFIFARIGMAHMSVSLFFYLFVFLLVLISIHLSLSKLHAVMSANTIQMHRTLIKALVAQMILPMGSLCLPLIGAAASIKFGSILPPSLSKIGGQLGLMVTCMHSPLNTISMILYVRPFRRYVLGMSSISPAAPRIVSNGPTQTNHSNRSL